jgi:hypothetical protein
MDRPIVEKVIAVCFAYSWIYSSKVMPSENSTTKINFLREASMNLSFKVIGDFNNKINLIVFRQ